MKQAISKSAGGAALLLLLFLGVGTVHLTCHQALFTAPPNTSIQLFANPIFIATHDGVSELTAYLVEPAGTVVADGTAVQFFTTLGRVEPAVARTDDGIARARLFADARSGLAQVTAVSGGPAAAAPAPSAAPSSQPSPQPAVSLPPAGGGSGTSSTIQVTIGNRRVSRVVVTAFPNRLTDQRTTLITANLFDAEGNPVPNVPVFFKVETARAAPTPVPSASPTASPSPSAPPSAEPGDEFMDSQGTPTFSDNNGQSKDVMRTRYDRELPPRIVKVTALTSSGVEGTVEVRIN